VVFNKRSKVSRQRGTHTHGGGSKKKRRGAGSRGGRGNAGTGKRGDAKKPNVWTARYFGKHGFKKHIKNSAVVTNIKKIEDSISTLEREGLAKKEGGMYAIDLSRVGYEKLLSAGTPKLKLKITVDQASKRAVEKIKAAGGEVNLLSGNADEGEAEEPVKKPEAAEE
jgi:large subunit ribosomal protein L15